MTNNDNPAAKPAWRWPVIVGVICGVLAIGYTLFMFQRAPSSARPNAPANTAASTPAPSTPPPAPLKVRIGTFSTAIDYAPLIVARSKGWMQRELGVPEANIEYTTFQTLPSINEAFAAGRLDAVFEAEVPAIVGRAADIDIIITGLGATLTEGIVVRSKLPVKSIAQLKGRSVAVLSGTAMHYGLLNLLQANNVDPNTVKVINMVPPDAAAAFASNQVDAWAIWPPWGEQQVIAKTGRFLSGGEAHVQSVIVMRGAFFRKNIKASQALLHAITLAKEWLQANPAEGVTLVAKELQLPETVVQAAWGKHDWSAQLNAQVIDDLAAKANFLLEQKMIQKPVAVADLVMPLKP